uniref:Ig-like domain-containing protein n=1 Tax=Esox lucius TaxID=8010 RepID=A0A3P8ZQV5_ESOLU
MFPLSYYNKAFIFSAGQTVESQLVIRSVVLTIEPRNSVSRGTDVTVRCQATINSDRSAKREYTIYRDDTVVYTHSSNTSEDVLYRLPDARVANAGKYKCLVKVQDKEQMSLPEKLTLTGLKTPILHIDKKVLSEGENVKMRCSAPEETGNILFTFYMDSTDLKDVRTNTSQVEMTYNFKDVGVRRLHCDYKVILLANAVSSNISNVIDVTVKELEITPTISVQPHGTKIIEGDNLTISCSVNGNKQNSSEAKMHLLKGSTMLSFGETSTTHSMTAMAEDSGKFECMLEMGTVLKQATEHVIITELFSKPVLVMEPMEVFEKEEFRLTCKSTNYSTERISSSKITYSIYRDNYKLTPDRFNGTYVVPANVQHQNGKYYCIANARNVSKYSGSLNVKAKVPVSKPEIMSIGKVIVGKPFQVRCHSDQGSLPINYTLLRRGKAINSIAVGESHHEAIFSITLQHHGDIEDYKCRAKNRRYALDSNKLNTTVIVPLSGAKLGISSDLSAAPSELSLDVAEGYAIYLLCSVQGSYPISFKWYKRGNAKPLYTITSTKTTGTYQIPQVTNEHSGNYYCLADNPAEKTSVSQDITVDVRMARWKKGLIVACCLLVVAFAVIGCVLHFRSQRGARDDATELSVKPSSPKSDDSLTVSLAHDTMEVYNPPKDAALHLACMRGRAINGTRDSVTSLPADNSNRSSYSIPATV